MFGIGQRSGGGWESNPPTVSPRRTGFEDREGHQSPFASRARDGIEEVASQVRLGIPPTRAIVVKKGDK